MPKITHLLNAAVMPSAGVYHLEQIAPDDFKAGVRAAYQTGNLKHYIGYETTLDLVRRWVRIDLGDINVDQTEMQDRDTFLVLRLRRRVAASAKVRTRGEHAQLEIEDFDFYRGTYYASRESYLKMDTRGKLLNIKQAELLLLDGKEVGSIGFEIQTETEAINAYALASEGTAFQTLENNPRFQSGVGVEITGIQTDLGFKVLTIRLDDPANASGVAVADIQALKDRAMQNMNLTQGELHALLAEFSHDSPQAYAIAIQLRRQHRDRTVAISEKVCRCQQCRTTFELQSPRYTFAWGKSQCPQCAERVAFDLVDPLPREATESEKPDWQETQKQLEKRFGGGKKGKF